MNDLKVGLLTFVPELLDEEMQCDVDGKGFFHVGRSPGPPQLPIAYNRMVSVFNNTVMTLSSSNIFKAQSHIPQMGF